MMISEDDQNLSEEGELKSPEYSYEGYDNSDSLDIKPPQIVHYKKSHSRDTYSRRKNYRDDRERSSKHSNKRKSDRQSERKDKRSSLSKRKESSSDKTREKEFLRSKKENHSIDDTDLLNLRKLFDERKVQKDSRDKIVSSSKFQDERRLERREIYTGDREIRQMKINKDNFSSSRDENTYRIKDKDKFDSYKRTVYQDVGEIEQSRAKTSLHGEKKQERSHKHKKEKYKERNEEKIAHRERYEMEEENRERVALAMAMEQKKQSQRNTSIRDLEKISKQKLYDQIENSIYNTEPAKKNRSKKRKHSPETNVRHRSKLKVSEESESSDDSDEDSSSSTSSSDSDSDDSDSSSSSSSNSDSDDSSQSEELKDTSSSKKKKMNKNSSLVPKEEKHSNDLNGSDNNDNSDFDLGDSNNLLNKDKNSDINYGNDTPSTLSADQLVKSDKSNMSSPAYESNEKSNLKSELELMEDLPPYNPGIQGCRGVEEYKILKNVAEGTYGVVYRALDKRTKEVVALKRLKMEKEKEGFPITSLREINTLLKAQHPNIVTVREIVVGNDMDKIFIVMDFIEYDLKSFMEKMKQKNQKFSFEIAKSLMKQLLRAVNHMHDNWIIHRDLKTSNLLISSNGILKVGDFGLAREYGSPLKRYTSIVVTLWYRAPELLLGCKQYSTPIDIWSVGCIFAEILTMKALFPGRSEGDLIKMIFKEFGTPNDEIWPGFSELPVIKKVKFENYHTNNFRQRLSLVSHATFDLITKFFIYDPAKRITAEAALEHSYFKKEPACEGFSVNDVLTGETKEETNAPVGAGFSLRF